MLGGYTLNVMPRFHGEDDPYYTERRRLLGLQRVKGRTTCSHCGHQLFYSPPGQLQESALLAGALRMCAQCAVLKAVEDGEVLDVVTIATLAAQIDGTNCQADPCAYA